MPDELAILVKRGAASQPSTASPPCIPSTQQVLQGYLENSWGTTSILGNSTEIVFSLDSDLSFHV